MRTSRMTSRTNVPAPRTRGAGLGRRARGSQGIRPGGTAAVPAPWGQWLRHRRRHRFVPTERSGTRPAPSVTRSPGESTRPRTSVEPPTRSSLPPRPSLPRRRSRRPRRSQRPRPSLPPRPSRRPRPSLPTSIEPSTSTSAPSAAAGPTSDESGGLGTLGWILLAVLAVGLIAGLLIWRSCRKSAGLGRRGGCAGGRHPQRHRHPAAAGPDRRDRRAASPVVATTAGRADGPHRTLGPPAGRAPDDGRRTRSGQIRSLLQELVGAVDAENDALATGRDWRLLRPRVDEAGRALSAMPPVSREGSQGSPQPPTGQWPPSDDTCNASTSRP